MLYYNKKADAAAGFHARRKGFFMEIVLSRRNGEPTEITALAQKATAADLAAFAALQQAVHDAMPCPEQFVTNSDDELRRDLAEGLCIGVWAEGALAAYGILRYCGENDHNYARYLDVPAADWQYWANGDTIVVAPEWRGNGLQQKLMQLLEAWRRPDIIGVGCTVSPENAYSLENIRAMGFSVYVRRQMYGEHDRYVMEKRLPPLPGRYRHFKGSEYQMLAIAKHSETQEPMVVYQALYGEKGIWVRPAAMWFEHMDRGAYHGPRFVYLGA